MTEFSDFLYRRFCLQLRIAIVVAWLYTDHIVAFESDRERDRVIRMWLDTPMETLCLWLDSEWEDALEPWATHSQKDRRACE